jgi:TRAP-type C4-dicarboxylate transport system permease small subunit
MNCIAGAGLISMLVLVIGDIIGIKAFSSPIPGGIEIVAFLGVVVIGFAIAWTQVLHGHIHVDFFTMRLSPRAKAGLEVLTTLLGIILFALLAWQSWEYGQTMRITGEVSRLKGYPSILLSGGWHSAICVLFSHPVQFLKAILKVGKRWNQ